MKILIEPKQFESINDIFLSQISLESAEAIKDNFIITQNLQPRQSTENHPVNVEDPRIKIGRVVKSQKSQTNEKSIRIKSKISSVTTTAFKKEAGEVLLNSLKDHREERFRQAKWSYNIAIVFVVIGIIFVLLAIFYTMESSFTHFKSVVSFASSVFSNIFGAVLFKLYRDTNNRLDAIISKDIITIRKLIA